MIDRSAIATAEELMRSRYDAFVRHDEAHLLATWHRGTRPATVEFDPDLAWTGLEIVATEAGGPGDAKGTVEFRGSYVVGGQPGVLHEISRFVRVDGAWVYVRGKLLSS